MEANSIRTDEADCLSYVFPIGLQRLSCCPTSRFWRATVAVELRTTPSRNASAALDDNATLSVPWPGADVTQRGNRCRAWISPGLGLAVAFIGTGRSRTALLFGIERNNRRGLHDRFTSNKFALSDINMIPNRYARKQRQICRMTGIHEIQRLARRERTVL